LGQECGSVSDLKFTDEGKSRAYSKILFDPQQAQDLPKLEDSLQAKFNGLFHISVREVHHSPVKANPCSPRGDGEQ
jgi:hypothetical protein